MNICCVKTCKHKPYCRLSEEDTVRCPVEYDPRSDGLIFGKTWEEIQKMQQGTENQTEKSLTRA